MIVGVLAFHGDFAEHLELLSSMKVNAREVRTLEDLKDVDRLIIPGGESTVMSQFVERTELDHEIIRRVQKEKDLAVYGTCAGAILLAKTVSGKYPPKSLALLDLELERNAYGAQLQSFATELTLKNSQKKIAVSFIRAPVIRKVGKDVEILATHESHPVLVRQGRVLAGTFHPEIRGETAVHRLFLSL